MKDRLLHYLSTLPVKIYKRVFVPAEEKEEIVVKFRVFLQDRPGSLADLALLIAGSGGNISFFHYDRSVHSNRVVVEVLMPAQDDLESLLSSLAMNRYIFEETRVEKDDVQITSLKNILQIKVRLMNKPGTLAAFADLLKAHDANVIYMLYDEDIDPASAVIALATKDLGEIDRVLDAVNKAGYYYRVLYKGADEKEVEHIIGLKLVEKFFLRLRRLLADRDFDELKSIVDSSQELYADLIKFYEEAGNSLDAGDVFEKILALASKSRSKAGDRFSVIEMPLLRIDERVVLYSFRLPTTENIYLFLHDDEMTMIDSGYGVYYEDIKKLMRKKLLDPSKVRRIFLTHPDADHAGTTGYFAEEFGAEVFMHYAARGVIEHNNRAYGASGRLSNLNKYYTRLINKFTDCKFPEKARYFSQVSIGKEGEFKIIDVFKIGNIKFQVLESHGGHIPGHVFFLSREHGLVFTSDFLINIQSLSPEDRDILSVYRYLLTNPNSDSRIFRKESDALRDVIMALDGNLKGDGKYAIIFPGHGEYYRADSVDDSMKQNKSG